MHKYLLLPLAAAVCFFAVACNKSSQPPASAPAATAPAPASAPADAAKSGDAIDQKLQELAGSGATNCGRVPGIGDVSKASDCAMQASQSKHAFYVAYNMPGLVTGVAGAADGKLYTIQAEVPEGDKAGAAPIKLDAGPCPAALRVAQSGRVTCMALGAGMGGMTGGNPHGGGMPGEAGSSHGGMMAAPPGTPNPHGKVPTTPGTANPHGGAPLQRSSSN